MQLPPPAFPLTLLPAAAAFIDGLFPHPTPHCHSTSELRSVVAQPHFVSSAAFKRFYAFQFNHVRGGSGGSQHFLALVTTDSDLGSDVDAGTPFALRPGVSVHRRELERGRERGVGAERQLGAVCIYSC